MLMEQGADFDASVWGGGHNHHYAPNATGLLRQAQEGAAQMNITLQDLIELKESIGADSVRLSVHSGMPLQDPVVRLEVRRFESDAPQKVVGSKLVPCDDNLTAIVLARQIDPDWRNLCLPARGYLANLFAAFPRRSHAGNMARLSVRAAKEPRSCPAFF